MVFEMSVSCILAGTIRLSNLQALHERTAYFALFILGLPILIESLTQLQTDTIGILAALIYRTKFGGSWKISRRQFLIELEGFLGILPLIIVPSLVIDYNLSVEFGPSLTEVSLPILAAGTVAGLVVNVAAAGRWLDLGADCPSSNGARKSHDAGRYVAFLKSLHLCLTWLVVECWTFLRGPLSLACLVTCFGLPSVQLFS